MKQIKALFVTVILIFSLAGCASTSVKENPQQNVVSAPEEVSRFDDWQYKGFGYEMPVWVENALAGKLNAPDTKVFTESGINSDMSEQKLQGIIAGEDLTGYEVTGSTWVRVSESGEYFSIKIYKKKEQ